LFSSLRTREAAGQTGTDRLGAFAFSIRHQGLTADGQSLTKTDARFTKTLIPTAVLGS
jgi:hypothetical protein